MIRRLLDRLRPLLNRLPHDTLYIGGRPYMNRWYLFGYAPPPDEPNDKQQGFDSTPGARRAGWWWHDHGFGAVRLHEIVESDDSRVYHDHPWPFFSIVLAGSYTDEAPRRVATRAGAVTYCPTPGNRTDAVRRSLRAPAVNRKAATDLHVLEVIDGPVWSLFFTRPKVRSWGFAGPFGWMPWRVFDQRFPERDAWTEAGAR